MKRKIDELVTKLPSPIPSPDINAPSPEPDNDLELPDYNKSGFDQVKIKKNKVNRSVIYIFICDFF